MHEANIMSKAVSGILRCCYTAAEVIYDTGKLERLMNVETRINLDPYVKALLLSLYLSYIDLLFSYTTICIDE